MLPSRILCVCILLAPAHALAGLDLVVPIATTHIIYDQGEVEYNDRNLGIGMEYKEGRTTYGLGYVDRNSYREHSVFAVALYRLRARYKHAVFSVGGLVATGYKELSPNGVVVTPVLAVRIGNIRLLTTYPSGNILCKGKKDNCADWINLQYVHKF